VNSPSISNRSVPATGTTATTRTGRSVSLNLRLSRALAVLAERVCVGDRDLSDDPWLDVPEELEPVDDDALDEDVSLYENERHRRPAIIYSRATPWTFPADAVPADPYAVESDLRVTVHRPMTGRTDDPWAGEIVGEELQRIAVALDRRQGRALRATSRPEAFVGLEPMSQKQLAEEARISTSVLSRRRREIIEAPWGLAPLEFFWWKRDQGLDLLEARLLLQTLRSSPQIEARSAARQVAEVVAVPSEVANRIDAIRKQVPVMRSLLLLLPTLNLLAAALPHVDLNDLDVLVEQTVLSATGRALDNRGRGLVRLALTGVFVDLEKEP